MTANPLVLYMAAYIAYRTFESIGAVTGGYLGRRKRYDVSFFLIFAPYLACVLGPPLEYWYLDRTPGAVSMTAGAVLFAVAGFIRMKGMRDLGRGFSVVVEMPEDGKVVETGLYAHVRHPLYAAVLMFGVACPVFLDARQSWGATVLLASAIIRRLRVEERFLAENLDGYAEYRGRTRALIPGVY